MNDEMRYFSERETGEMSRESEEISSNVWRGLLAAVRSRDADGSFGARYPDICPDGTFVCGANMGMFDDALRAEIPRIANLIDQMYPQFTRTTLAALDMPDIQPSTLDILDLIEFCWKGVGKPIRRSNHSFFSHYHLAFDEEAGRSEYRDEVETIFRRNGIAYVLREDGRVERLASPVFQHALVQSESHTGDAEFNRLLSTAQRKFLDPRPEMRREALESLWDAWERLKTLDGEGDKRAQTQAMLDNAAGTSSPKFRDALESEAVELTNIGNSLRIRHSETNQEVLATNEHMDYLFYRLYSLVQLVLKSK